MNRHGTCGNCTWDVDGDTLIIFGIPGTDKRLAELKEPLPWRDYSPKHVRLIGEPCLVSGEKINENALIVKEDVR